MDKIIETYLKNKKEEQIVRDRESKEAILIEEGVYGKEYNPNGGYSEEFSIFDPDKGNYFKRIIPECSDEEFEEILKYRNCKKSSSNIISIILTVTAIIIYFVGFVVGIDAYNEYTSAPMFIAWGMAFLIGTSVFGFAEIIRLLDVIAKKEINNEKNI